jgi:hypothetical protein
MMRPSLVVSGGIISLTGVVLFVTLGGLAWLALIAGGAAALVVGFLAAEVKDRVVAPEGFHFCQFCSTPVMDGAERCSHCNGLQPPAPQPSAAPAPPNH